MNLFIIDLGTLSEKAWEAWEIYSISVICIYPSLGIID